MKITHSLIRLTVACLAAVTAITAFAFEGKIDMKMTTGKKDAEMPITYYVKGTHLRMEMVPPPDKKGRSPGTFTMIVDWPNRQSIMVMDEQKMYMTMKIPDVTEQAAGKGSDIDFKPTGRKEKIAGIEAEEYAGVSEGKRTEIWVTKELGKFMMANQGKGGGPFGRGKSSTSAWEKFAQQGDFFALRVVQREKEGGPEDFHMETIKVDRTTPSDALFQPPAGYQKFEMPSMGDAFKGMIPH
jgi:hypothetical protein